MSKRIRNLTTIRWFTDDVKHKPFHLNAAFLLQIYLLTFQTRSPPNFNSLCWLVAKQTQRLTAAPPSLPRTRMSELIWIRSLAFTSSVCRVTVVLSPLNLCATTPRILTSKETQSNAHRHSCGFLRCFFLDLATKCCWGKNKWINTVLMTLPKVCWSCSGLQVCRWSNCSGIEY